MVIRNSGFWLPLLNNGGDLEIAEIIDSGWENVVLATRVTGERRRILKGMNFTLLTS
jgi:hypothetical protein